MRFPVQETLPFEDLPEVPTASPWCQRWREGRHSWAHVRDGGFDARRYTVDVIPDEEPAKGFVLAHHYSGSYPAVTVQFGLYDVVDGERRLCGVAVFGVPVSTAVLTKPLPELRPYTESLVCSRFVLLDECPANSESWFLANCLKRLLARGVHGVVSFADPVPRRTASGLLVMPGHVGTIYAATNAVYASRATARTVSQQRLDELCAEVEQIAELLVARPEAAGEAIEAFNAMTGHDYVALDFAEYYGSRSLEEFAKEAARPARPVVADINRDELVEIVRRLLTASAESGYYLRLLEANVSHPRVSDLVFHPSDILQDPSAEQIVDEALKYRPIAL